LAFEHVGYTNGRQTSLPMQPTQPPRPLGPIAPPNPQSPPPNPATQNPPRPRLAGSPLPSSPAGETLPCLPSFRPPHILPAHQQETRDARKPRGAVGGGADRLSDLPDGVLELVLSFLPAADAVRTSVPSRRFRGAWAHAPALNLSDGLLKGRFLGFAREVLARRGTARSTSPRST
jgi:hypothetical protein